MAIGYLDVFCGISGDMLLGALVDAGVDPEDLRAALRRLPMAGWELQVAEVRKAGLRATQVKVVAADEETDHHHGRGPDDLIAIIRGGELAPGIAERAVAVVERIAQAEAACHGVPREQVHFHELGGLDTVIDVVGAVLGLGLLGVDRLYCSPLPVTHGFINTDHGRLPVPAPAVAKLLEGAPTYGLDIEGETVTPTGAALAVSLSTVGTYPSMRLTRTGWGAGQRDFAVPNLLRLFIGEATGDCLTLPSDTIVLLEANLDDMSPELYARAMDQAFAAGAVDVWATPIQMKKNRPAFTMSVLAPPECSDAVSRAMLRETTSFGVRRQLLQRQCLDREHVTVSTPYGDIRVKVGRLDGEALTVAPEYTDCLAAAEATGAPMKNVHQAALAAFWSASPAQ